jgi:hypothetical protein
MERKRKFTIQKEKEKMKSERKRECKRDSKVKKIGSIERASKKEN